MDRQFFVYYRVTGETNILIDEPLTDAESHAQDCGGEAPRGLEQQGLRSR